MTPQEVRATIRSGRHKSPTSGLAPGALQANLVILPKDRAQDFTKFCMANPRPCPLLARSEFGDPRLPDLGDEIDLRYDLPGYLVWKAGQVIEERGDIGELGHGSLVAFALGCSFGFEDALQKAGIPLRHIATGRNVAMYDSSIALMPVGEFSGNMVVSMRPIRTEQIDEVVRICSKFPLCHGAPIHVGAPEKIGISDLKRVDYGEASEVLENEVPVFWACGVTPQNVIRNSRASFAITHAPGKMLICDVSADWRPC